MTLLGQASLQNFSSKLWDQKLNVDADKDPHMSYLFDVVGSIKNFHDVTVSSFF